MLVAVLKVGMVVAAGLTAGIVAYYTYYQGANAHQERGHTWRSTSSPPQRRRRRNPNGSQRQILTDDLNSGTAECSICMCVIQAAESTYVCPACRSFFHLKCSEAWALHHLGFEFRCPHCNIHQPKNAIKTYVCMCGQTINPKLVLGRTPHCCEKNCLECDRPCHPGHCD